MVKSCAVFNCTQRYEKGISFHQFPGDKALLKRWLSVMKQQDWTPTKFSLICSRHFTEDCYEKNGWSSQKKLKANAVPSVFNFSEKLDMKKKLRPRVSEKNVSNSKSTKSSTEVLNNTQVQSGKPVRKREGKLPNKKDSTPVKCSKTLKQSPQSEIKMLQQSNKLLKKKLSNLEALVKFLKEKSVVIEPPKKVSKKRGKR